jgi:hypothetical protein
MATNVDKAVTLTALERQYVKAAIVLYRASVQRAMRVEKDPEVVRLRQATLDGLNLTDSKFSS